MFPTIYHDDLICVDIETEDPDLEKLGPGTRRGAEILGVAVATSGGHRQYYSFGHDTGNNCEFEVFRHWWNNNILHFNGELLGANIMYDLDFLRYHKCTTFGNFRDIQVLEPLIDETQRSFNLNALAKKYVGEAKRETELEELRDKMGLKGKVQKHLRRFPGGVVARYALGDVDLTMQVYEKQLPLIKSNNLQEVAGMEHDLIPMLLAMRERGVRVDKGKVEEARETMESELSVVMGSIEKLAETEVNIWSNDSLGVAMDKLGIEYNRTAKTNKPQVTKDFLSGHPHQFMKLVLEARKRSKLITTFIDGLVLGHLVGDRVHPTFNQLRSDDSGTVSGRFSCSNPNLQQIPSPDTDEELGTLCRSFFIPEDGERWAKLDYSQIELRILAHYALGDGAEAIRDAYRDNPKVDFHQMCADMAGISRRHAKNINFGIVYGMGARKTAQQLGLEYQEAKDFLKRYNQKMPFLKHTSSVCQSAANRGFVRTVLGRRRHFPFWQPADYELAQTIPHTRDKEKMIEFVKESRTKASEEGTKVPAPGVQRSMRHKALNAVIQGSAADLMKKAMVDLWKSGVCNEMGAPLITVHDELDLSFTYEHHVEAVREIMEKSMTFEVPVIADVSIGENWSKAK